MVTVISGTNGMGKTTYLLDSANNAIKEASGDIVYVDKSSHKMHDLSTKIRLVDMSRYPIANYDNFIGYIYGLISQNYDLEKIYLDSFIKLAHISKEDISRSLEDIVSISKNYNVDFYLGVSMDAQDLPSATEGMEIIAM